MKKVLRSVIVPRREIGITVVLSHKILRLAQREVVLRDTELAITARKRWRNVVRRWLRSFTPELR